MVESPDSASFPGCNAARWPTIVALAATVATAGLLRLEGRRWWCACGEWSLVSADAWGSHNSQHLFDPYSLTHMLHGVLFCGALALVVPRLGSAWRFAASVILECLWELLENSPLVIDRYRTATAALGYTGDSVLNSVGDVVSCAAGFWLARRLGWWRSIALVAIIEVGLLFWIRDNLTLNIIMLIYPIDAIRLWQAGG